MFLTRANISVRDFEIAPYIMWSCSFASSRVETSFTVAFFHRCQFPPSLGFSCVEISLRGLSRVTCGLVPLHPLTFSCVPKSRFWSRVFFLTLQQLQLLTHPGFTRAYEGHPTLADFLSQSCRFFIRVKFVGTSACRTLADFLSRLTAFSLGAESPISAMFEKRLVHVTLMTIPHWLRYARAPKNCLGLPHTSRQDVLRFSTVRISPDKPRFCRRLF